MRVLVLFLHNSQWGVRIRGDERRFLEIAKRLEASGARLYVIEFRPSIQKHYYGKRLYRSIELQSNRFLYVFFYMILLALRMRKHIDCIYAYNQDLLNILGALIFKLIQGKPLIQVVQSLQDLELSLKTLRSMYGSSAIDLVFLLLYKALLPLVLRLASVIVTTTKTLKSELSTRFSWALGKIIITGNGVDLNKFRPLNFGKVYDVVYIGRIHIFHKGLDNLLLAWKAVSMKYPSAKIIIAGGYESERDKELLSKLITRLGLAKNVIITGFISDDKLVEILNSSKFFISLSRYEGFGLSVLEAMACGTPCILSDLQVFKELHGNLPLYVSSQSYKDVALTLYKALTSPYITFSSLSALLRKHAEKFTWDYVSLKELILIKNLALRQKTNIPKVFK